MSEQDPPWSSPPSDPIADLEAAAEAMRKQSDWLASPEHRREVIEEEARWTLAARRLVACGVDPFGLSVLRSRGVMVDAFEREANRLELRAAIRRIGTEPSNVVVQMKDNTLPVEYGTEVVIHFNAPDENLERD